MGSLGPRPRKLKMEVLRLEGRVMMLSGLAIKRASSKSRMVGLLAPPALGEPKGRSAWTSLLQTPLT